jgi:beta-barrel assembly-enhancing protease
MLIGQMINLKYSRADETEADKYGACFMNAAGFDPYDMIKVMQVLQSLDPDGNTPEFFSTHASPASRIAQIQQDIQNMPNCPQ